MAKKMSFGGLKLIKTMTCTSPMMNFDCVSIFFVRVKVANFTVTKNNAGVPIYKACISKKNIYIFLFFYYYYFILSYLEFLNQFGALLLLSEEQREIKSLFPGNLVLKVGVGEKINSPMHRNSLFNDSESILSLFFFFLHMARVCARDAAGFIAQNLRCETRAHCLTVCASTHRVLL